MTKLEDDKNMERHKQEEPRRVLIPLSLSAEEALAAVKTSLIKHSKSKDQKNDGEVAARVDLEVAAKHKIERFRQYNLSSTTEEVLLDMAKSFVSLEKMYYRQENFLSVVLGSATLGSIFLGVLSLISGEWGDLTISIIIFIATLAISIYIYGNGKKIIN